MKIKKDDIKISFYKSRGPGGQRKNKKETAVKITHIPTGITVRATEFRSQSKNRKLALKRLKEKIEKLNTPVKKRIPTKKPEKAKIKQIEEKRKRSEKKKLRKPIRPEENQFSNRVG